MRLEKVLARQLTVEDHPPTKSELLKLLSLKFCFGALLSYLVNGSEFGASFWRWVRVGTVLVFRYYALVESHRYARSLNRNPAFAVVLEGRKWRLGGLDELSCPTGLD